MGNARNRQIVLLTVFATILVVIGHSDITDDFKNLWIYKWVYSFHMPLFFFISGFLFCYTLPVEKLRNTTFFSFVKKKAIRLMIPFLFINTVIFVIKSRLSDPAMMQNPVTLDWGSFLDSTLFNPMGFMWFLPTLFVIFAVVFLMYKYLKNSKINGGGYLLFMFLAVIGMAILSVFLPKIKFMQVSNAVYYASYFLTGIIYCDYKIAVDRFLRKYWVVIGVLTLAASVSLMFSKYVAALSGICFSLVLSLLLEDKCSDTVVRFSAFSYTVFLLSYFPQMLLRGPISHIFPSVNQYLLSVASFVVGLAVPVIIGVIAMKIKERSPRFKNIFKLIGI